ncbi:class I SAM-dependent methyltransferase [Lacrimispora sp.]|uniref:class I SAM-dependent methyltransferase n=1 Tax=Lacrimispora sp. TaxID=2719234 RepID=UPI0029E79368|nr:hypothetical protein [Lacrimispora sp.]
MNNFNEIKKITNGYLHASIYKKIYDYALNAPIGIVVDIGPAQGGSTICFAKAMLKNQKLKKIISIDKFYESAALKYYDDVNRNINVIQENLQYFGLDNNMVDFVTFDELDTTDEFSEKISILFIDADGSLDRDFKSYFNQVVTDGIIIIDDYEKIINLQARNRFLKWQSDRNMWCFLDKNRVNLLENYPLLGKQNMIYDMVNYFIENNFIEIIENDSGTIFCKKKFGKQLSEKNMEELNVIRQDQKNTFLKYRKVIIDEYSKVKDTINEICKILNMNHAILYEYYYYAVKSRYQMAKVYETHTNEQENIEDDFIIQDLPTNCLNELDQVLIHKDFYQVTGGNSVIDIFLTNMGYNEKIYIALKNNNCILGILILFDSCFNDDFSANALNNLVMHFSKEFELISKKSNKLIDEMERNLSNEK